MSEERIRTEIAQARREMMEDPESGITSADIARLKRKLFRNKGFRDRQSRRKAERDEKLSRMWD
ncbi:MAG: hypothetical protein ACYS7Y_04280 [Planctomycetota bacterium]|jgi:hypothetical protein